MIKKIASIHLCLSYRKSLQPSKEIIRYLKKCHFLCLLLIFALLDPDPDCESGFGYVSRDPI